MPRFGVRRRVIRSIFTRETNPGLRTAFLAIIAIALMVMDRRMESFAAVRAAMTLPVAPIQYIVSWPTQMVDQIKTVIRSHDDLIKQNLQLQSNQLLLQSQLQRSLAIESENNYLKSLLSSAQKLHHKMLIAELLAVDTAPYVNQITIDKGSREGVYIGQPVIDATGVMGQVVQVGPITSRVILINDPRSGVAIQNTRNGLRTVAVGDSYTGKIKLLYVAKTADIKVGDIYITSGLGDKYPEGYPVGSVVAVKNDPTKPFAEIYLQPSAHLSSTRQVLLVWYQKHA